MRSVRFGTIAIDVEAAECEDHIYLKVLHVGHSASFGTMEQTRKLITALQAELAKAEKKKAKKKGK